MIENEYFRFSTGKATDQGRVRDHNEDSLMTRQDFGVWVVADGMGGHDAGDFASQAITHEVASVGMSSSLQDLTARFMERLTRAHDTIRAHPSVQQGGTVGSTVVALLTFEDTYACVWSGDSRIYLLRDGQLVQQTTDHTEVQELLSNGAISEAEAETWPRKNVITRAVGVWDDPRCDIIEGQLQDGDVFLLCSDGLTEHLSDSDIHDHLEGIGSGEATQDVCNELITVTLDRGAKDNVTCVVMQCMAQDGGV
ncbi:Serine/threonine phosphatase stp [Ascidiaceihabitans donghaensis]|uniref:Serine/threonine phosphatase stp n=1 Tax=Ascidiaceihabitans donghaensis TaxID=1510460 RepID=A0A2R8BPL2_9RHOB|nr:protein phosphatase 2C domain-containing protein [Ascidiaceihabitans donghaensis]SPH27515.1 Serine/threonine phosphatase stp [Ascidiaceihabitans donghaensis]